MKQIKEFMDKSGDPCVLVSSFHDADGKLYYMVDNLRALTDSTMFEDKQFALDYAQAKTNHINRKLS